jgi:hypothetical protein
MRKEVLIAIAIGFLVGILIAYGVYTANRAVKQTETQTKNSILSSAAPSPITQNEFMLNINEPENNLVFNTPQATISGQTEPEATVAIISEEQEELITADSQGFFSSSINLISGVNEIKVITIKKTGEQQEKILNLVYSKAEIE